jgi:uncharacterized repeat protein (TIGR03806 family)
MVPSALQGLTLRRRGAFVLLLGVLLAGCGGGSNHGGGNGNPPPPPPPNGGLDARPSNATCVAPARGTAGAQIDLVDAFPNLPAIGGPTKMLVEPVANPRWFVLRKSGQLMVFDPANATSAQTYLDLSGVVNSAGEGGLLGMAFHPDYPATAQIFLSYTTDSPNGNALLSVISRVILDDVTTPSPIGAGSVEQVLLTIDQYAANHDGGDVAFGPDGYLYVGFGDGGGAGDPQSTGQDTTRLLGSFLRLDVIGTGAGYDIPADNPFAGNPQCGPASNAMNCPEIYAFGVRNPWRWNFDPPTGALWLGDVGQNLYEEVDRVELGKNYGWSCREGLHDYDPADPSGCNGPFEEPLSEYPHTNGNNSITGGFVYRGSAIPALVGRYVFADFGSGRIWALAPDGAGGYTNEELADTQTGPSSFGVGPDGELYITDYNGGRIMRLVAAGGGTDPVPELLSDSGCTDPADVTQPYAGLVPYTINAPFWSDGAAKDRYLGLPNGTTISVDADDDWVFPPGTVVVKNFRLNGRLIETRHLMRHPDGIWAGYTYEWNAAGTEATRVHGGKTAQIDGQGWIFPDEAECMNCHTAAAGVALGPETAQLNGDFTYPSTGRTANQLTSLDAVSMFASPIGDPAVLPALADPTDVAADLDARARAYLHVNCSQCHRPGGPTPVSLDFRYQTLLADTNACGVAPTAGDLGIPMAEIIAPGDSAHSVLVARMDRRDGNGMPPLASSLVDSDGVTLISDWIDGLANCN